MKLETGVILLPPLVEEWEDDEAAKQLVKFLIMMDFESVVWYYATFDMVSASQCRHYVPAYSGYRLYYRWYDSSREPHRRLRFEHLSTRRYRGEDERYECEKTRQLAIESAWRRMQTYERSSGHELLILSKGAVEQGGLRPYNTQMSMVFRSILMEYMPNEWLLAEITS